MKLVQGKQFNILFFLLWLIIVAVIWVVSDYHQHDPFSKIIFLGLQLFILILTTYILCNILLPSIIMGNKIYLFIVILVGISLIQATSLYYCDVFLNFLEQKKIISPSLDGAPDELFVAISSFTPIALLLNLGFGGLRFLYDHSRLSEKNNLLQKNLLESQIATLQAQINPHFTFNILNHIHILMQTNQDKASVLLLKYADMLRYQLYEGNKDLTSLMVEISFLKDFITIEGIRWDNRLSIDCSWEIRDPQTKISPFLFFTLLENAFKHVSKSTSNLGFVTVKMWQEKTKIHFVVANSISTATILPKNRIESGLGLYNLRKRLELIYPDRHLLKTQQNETEYITELIIQL